MILSRPILARYGAICAGLAIHPTVEAGETIDRKAIPDHLSARAGDASDLNLVASVDAGLRGSR